MAVIRYIADLHFGDENIIAYDNRPFLSVSEMNEALIERWNRVVGKDDLTWMDSRGLLCGKRGRLGRDSGPFKRAQGPDCRQP